VLDRQSGREEAARMHAHAMRASVNLGHPKEDEIDQPRGDLRLPNISVHGAERLHPGRQRPQSSSSAAT
jgi:hypothetical protein